MLKIENLHVSVEGKEILKGVSLEVKKSEVHAIMGPNGSGKSTLSSVIDGNEDYEVTKGNIYFNDVNIDSARFYYEKIIDNFPFSDQANKSLLILEGMNVQ